MYTRTMHNNDLSVLSCAILADIKSDILETQSPTVPMSTIKGFSNQFSFCVHDYQIPIYTAVIVIHSTVENLIMSEEKDSKGKGLEFVCASPPPS